jgi:hypothetical protein
MNPCLLLIAASLLIVPPTQAQSACPWLTEGTAAATLGGPAATAVQLSGDPNRPMGSCIFARQGNAATTVLEIAVSSAPPGPACPSTSPKLTGIGNEATFCRLDSKQIRYVINSRVRDLYFRVSLAIPAPAPAFQPLDHEREQIQLIAEQVAGSLY